MEKLVQDATAKTLTSEDWSSIIQVCEVANVSDSNARAIVIALSKRFANKNANVN